MLTPEIFDAVHCFDLIFFRNLWVRRISTGGDDLSPGHVDDHDTGRRHPFRVCAHGYENGTSDVFHENATGRVCGGRWTSNGPSD